MYEMVSFHMFISGYRRLPKHRLHFTAGSVRGGGGIIYSIFSRKDYEKGRGRG